MRLAKIFLIVDNLRVHRSVKVSKWVAAHNDEIELLFLPTYAPEQSRRISEQRSEAATEEPAQAGQPSGTGPKHDLGAAFAAAPAGPDPGHDQLWRPYLLL
jgi:hypothetical protein